MPGIGVNSRFERIDAETRRQEQALTALLQDPLFDPLKARLAEIGAKMQVIPSARRFQTPYIATGVVGKADHRHFGATLWYRIEANTADRTGGFEVHGNMGFGDGPAGYEYRGHSVETMVSVLTRKLDENLALTREWVPNKPRAKAAGALATPQPGKAA